MKRASFTFAILLCTLAVGENKIHAKPSFVRAEQARSPIEYSAISYIIRANGGKLPITLAGFRRALESFGPVDTAVVPYSDAPAPTSLNEPRLLYVNNDGPELFIGAIPRLDGTVEFEFISRNTRTGNFDFGIIRNFGMRGAQVEFPPPEACFECHKNRGPIFRDKPWSNMTANPALNRAFINALAEREKQFPPLRDKIEQWFKKTKTMKEFRSHLAKNLNRTAEENRWHGVNVVDFGEPNNEDAARYQARVETSNGKSILLQMIGELDGNRRQLLFSAALNFEILRSQGGGKLDDMGNKAIKDIPISRFASLPANRHFILSDVNPVDQLLTADERKTSPTVSDPFNPKHSELVNEFEIQLRAKKVAKFSKEQLASSESAFVKSQLGVLPLLGDGGSLKDLLRLGGENLVGLSPIERSVLRQTIFEMVKEKIFADSEYGVLDGKDHLLLNEALSAKNVLKLMETVPPSREYLFPELMKTLAGIAEKRNIKLPKRLIEIQKVDPIPDYLIHQSERAGSCMACHSGAIRGLEFSFDPSDPAAWKKQFAIANEKNYRELIDFARDVEDRVKRGNMPPSRSEEAKTFDGKRKILLKYFSELEK